MVSFRLTKEEYDRVHDVCFQNGLGSVSEMARAGLHLLLEQPDRAFSESLESRVAELEGRLRMLSLEMKKWQSNFSATLTRFSGVPVALPE